MKILSINLISNFNQLRNRLPVAPLINFQKGFDNCDEFIRESKISENKKEKELNEKAKIFIEKEKINIDEFKNFYKKINFDKISKIAPKVKTYSPWHKALFALVHFQNKNLNFNKDTLKFNENLTEYLKNNFADSDKIEEILITYPLTSRLVGDLPQDWIKNINSKEKDEILEDVDFAISTFQNKRNRIKFAESLSMIIGKDVDIERIGNGAFGCVYKIDVENAKSTCLKMFYDIEENPIQKNFGQFIEPQIGLFGNAHSDKLVKMYFGKVSPKGSKNGYIVTQFLDKNIKAEENIIDKTKEYEIIYEDDRKDNVINKKIVDYGGVLFKKD